MRSSSSSGAPGRGTCVDGRLGSTQAAGGEAQVRSARCSEAIGVVLRDDDRDARRGERADRALQGGDPAVVELRGGFVQQQQSWAQRQSPGDRDALAFAARQRVDRTIMQVFGRRRSASACADAGPGSGRPERPGSRVQTPRRDPPSIARRGSRDPERRCRRRSPAAPARWCGCHIPRPPRDRRTARRENGEPTRRARAAAWTCRLPRVLGSARPRRL